MRIKELQIDGFAALNGVNVLLDAPVTVVVGPNEAGKSTLHRFIRSMLYGFANRGQPAERGEPIHGGRHGGRLLLTDGVRDYTLERHGDVPTRRGGPVAVLRDADGAERPVGQAELERLWLGGVSERMFRQLFAVTLEELHELRSLQGEEVGNYLYHSGMAGGASLTSAIKSLTAEMEKLYKPRGEQPELNKLLAELKEAEAALKASRKGAGPYNEAVMELRAVEKELRAVEDGLPERQRQAALAQSAANAREEWLRTESLRLEEEDLALSLPDPGAEPLPEHAEAKWESLLARRTEDRERLAAAEQEREGIAAALRGLSWQDELVSHLPELEALEARRESVAARRDERAELAADIRLMDENIASMLGRLSSEWKEADLQAFASLPERERSRQLLAAMQEAERKLEQTLDELRRLERQQAIQEEEERELEEAAGKRRQGQASEETLLPAAKEELLAAWNELEDARNGWERASWEEKLAAEAIASWGHGAGSDAESGQDAGNGRSNDAESGHGIGNGRSKDADSVLGTGLSRSGGRGRSSGKRSADGLRGRFGPRWLSAIAGAFAVAAIAVPIASGKPAGEAFGYYLLGAGLTAFAALNVWPQGSGTSVSPGSPTAGGSGEPERQRRLAEASQRLRDCEHRLSEAAAKLMARPASARSIVEDVNWQRLRTAVQERLGRFEQEAREREASSERERKRAGIARERERLEQEKAEAQFRYERKRAGWLAWLDERKLGQGLPPELLPELFQLAEQALQAYRQRARMQERAAQLLGGVSAFEASAAELFAACPPPPAASGDPLLAVKLLHAEALRQREIAAEASRLDERLRRALAASEAAREAAEASEAAIRAAWEAAGDADEAAYERRLRVDERRRAIRRERREAELRLAAGRDASGLAELQATLARADEAALAVELAQARQALREQEQRRSELLERRGRLLQHLERLRAEAETDDRVLAIEECNAEIDRLAERYAVLAICGELIRRTKTVFEEDKQPHVLHKASRYFSILTAGAYARIIAPGDSPVLLAETKDRRAVDSSFLSRGTREQLYLALRFALAEATSPEQELPLLLDDLFVHFDETRLRHAASVLAEVSAERQIILFTCHERTAEIIARGVPDAALVRMKEWKAALAEAGYPSP
ncbi:AAA family ATPase [Cohnella sp. AR92]|uniref:AAA family ATPase n=1 Tax=Cohnella sp. AR92 TaxID=648716 RepID=UPI000F8F0416|nr:AAA family ATPase [Cohnella sp. AR92]RUS43877.1 hypothetical protein ELR57_23695 [Cohnella sp. AR92]